MRWAWVLALVGCTGEFVAAGMDAEGPGDVTAIVDGGVIGGDAHVEPNTDAGRGGGDAGVAGDAAALEAGSVDSGVSESGLADAGALDAAGLDAGMTDAGAVDTGGGEVPVCVSIDRSAGDYYVDAQGGDDASPGTADAPFRTIQRAAEAAQAGQTVVVRDGVYAAPGAPAVLHPVRSGNATDGPITFRSEHVWGAVVDASQSIHRAVNLGTGRSYIVIDGFEVRDSPNNGIKLHGDNHHIEILRNNIHGHHGAAGIQIAGEGSCHDVVVDGNYIHHNGDSVFGSPGDANYDPDNVNKDHGMYIAPSDTVIRNNVFTHHEHGWAIQFSEGAFNVQVYNNVFAYPNPGRDGHIVLWRTNTNITIANNIFYEPRNAALAFAGGTRENLVVRNNLTTAPSMSDGDEDPGTVFDGNVTGTDPQLVSTAPMLPVEFRLAPGSSAIDMGLPLGAVPHDYDGRCRPLGATHDVGAFEVASE